jgi:CHAD domain-containing protein
MQLSKNRQQDYFRERWENFLHHYEQFSKRTNPEDLHRMRVELKKIRAVFFIQKKAKKNDLKEVSALVRKIFRMGGTIREAQVNAQLVKRAGTGSVEFFTAHRNTVAKQSKALTKFINRHADELITANTKAWKSLRGISGGKIRKLNKKLLDEARSAFFPRLKIRALHDGRKAIKRMVYLHSMLSNKNAEALQEPYELLRKLEEETGKWHDVVVAKQLLRKFPRAGKTTRMLEQKRKQHLSNLQKLAEQTFAPAKTKTA